MRERECTLAENEPWEGGRATNENGTWHHRNCFCGQQLIGVFVTRGTHTALSRRLSHLLLLVPTAALACKVFVGMILSLLNGQKVFSASLALETFSSLHSAATVEVYV